jgi:hypothetical protein
MRRLIAYLYRASADMCSGENNLSFIETSALDASNVELAFQNILTGTFGHGVDVALGTVACTCMLRWHSAFPDAHAPTPPLPLVPCHSTV